MSRGEDLTGLVAELVALGFPAPQPPPLGQARSFDWVADCLAWLCTRAAPGLAVPPRDYSSEAARVAFFSGLGAAFYEQTHIRLNLRRLYRAGGGAARELHRLAGAVRAAAAAVAAAPPLQAGPPAPAALQRQLEAGLAAARQQAAQLEVAVAAAGQEVAVLEGRVEKRHSELDRLERRLDSLQAIKPAHSAQVEALDAELGELYGRYLHKFRNLEYLEGVLGRCSAAQQAEAEEADRRDGRADGQLRHIQRQVAAEELALLQGGSNGDPSAAAAGALGALDSDDSEAELSAGLGGKKVLPRLEAGALGGAGSLATAAAALDLLPGEDSGVAAGAGGGSGRSRLSMASDGAVAVLGEGRVKWGGATQIPAHHAESRPGGAGGGPGVPARPSSARRTTGSGNALLRKAASSGGGIGGGVAGGAVDVLILDSSLPRRSLQPGDSDF